ncbi:MAG: hypothetical protein HY000_42075 [Planctomycetes bacterium]|nr:hypothetical protein [Planctomycetota bacterium]
MERRVQPAVLLNGFAVQFQDADGDSATVTISQPLLNLGNVNSVLTFDVGAVDGTTTTPQQLRRIDLTALGGAAQGISVTVAAEQAGGDGLVHVGAFMSGGLDVGTIDIEGDLGRIVAGDGNAATTGLQSLIAQSFGAMGTSTQGPGGSFVSSVNGRVESFKTVGDFDCARLEVAGSFGLLHVGGSLVGRSSDYTGMVLGGVLDEVRIDQSMIGGGGIESGTLRMNGLGDVHVGGDMRGGAGDLSARLRSYGGIGSVSVGGSLIGGTGGNSATIRSEGGIGPIQIAGDLRGVASGSAYISAQRSIKRQVRLASLTKVLCGRIWAACTPSAAAGWW